MLLLPLGLNQSRGDQIENSRYFSAKKWAHVVAEDELTAEKLLVELTTMLKELETRKKHLENAPAESALIQIGDCLLSLLEASI